MFYSTSTFDKAGISNPDAATCGTGVVSIIVIGISVCNTIYINNACSFCIFIGRELCVINLHTHG